jgi:hypothetical protein
MAAAKTTMPEPRKALAQREASINGPAEERVDRKRLTFG